MGSHLTTTRLAEGEKAFADLPDREKQVLRKLWKNLSERGPHKESVDKTSFLRFFDLPGMFSERVWSLFDVKHNDIITEEEFLGGLAWYMTASPTQKAKTLFLLYDINGQKQVNTKELKLMFSSLVQTPQLIPGISDVTAQKISSIKDNPVELDQVLEELLLNTLEKFDTSKTGMLSEEEFTNAVLSSRGIMEELDHSFNMITQVDVLSGAKSTGQTEFMYLKRKLLGYEKIRVALIGRIFYMYKRSKIPNKVIFLQGLSISHIEDATAENKGFYGIKISSEFKTHTLYAKGKAEGAEWLARLQTIGQAIPVESVYTFGKVIGQGAFGTVYAGTDKKTSVGVAIKELDKTGLSDLIIEGVRSEVAILKLVHHPNIITMFDVFEKDKKMWMVLELVSGGDLETQIQKKTKEKGRFPEEKVKEFAYVLLETLQYCHRRGITHRDLKPDNILMRNPEDIGDIVLTDFGMSQFADPDEYHQNQVGSLSYMAPEILIAHCYTARVDVWSAGVIIYELLCNRVPYYARDEKGLRAVVRKNDVKFEGALWQGISKQAKDFCKGLLCRDALQRTPIEEALHDPWLKGIDVIVADKRRAAGVAIRPERRAGHVLTASMSMSQSFAIDAPEDIVEKLIGSIQGLDVTDLAKLQEAITKEQSRRSLST